MNSHKLGEHTSAVEVTHVSRHGVWLLAGDRELFMPYDDFPWFKEAPIGKILSVEEPTRVISIGLIWMSTSVLSPSNIRSVSL